nr:MAG TPA: hypothetical protein [Caudoviricetes sp.]
MTRFCAIPRVFGRRQMSARTVTTLSTPAVLQAARWGNTHINIG